MSSAHKIWDAASAGLYFAFSGDDSKGNTQHDLMFDPTPDRETLKEQYLETIADGDMIVLFVKPNQTDLRAEDVTAEIHAEVNAYLTERGHDALDDLNAVKISDDFLTSAMLWKDGQFGSLARVENSTHLENMKSTIDAWMDTNGDHAVNAGIIGIIVRLTKKDDVWTATLVSEYPDSTPDNTLTEIGL